MYTSFNYYGNGWWWLRSPINYDSNCALGVHDYGGAGDLNYVYIDRHGVVPALNLMLS